MVEYKWLLAQQWASDLSRVYPTSDPKTSETCRFQVIQNIILVYVMTCDAAIR